MSEVPHGALRLGLVDFWIDRGVAWLRIDNDQRLNALSDRVHAGLLDAYERIESDDGVRASVLFGAGGRAFCVGADLKELAAADGHERSPERSGRVGVSSLSKPIIAAVDGYALGGGMQLAARCDIRLATRHSTFGMPEVTHGLVAAGDVDAPERFIPIGEAMLLHLSGRRMTAARAVEIGFVQHLADDRIDLLTTAAEVATAIASAAPRAVRAAKRLVRFSASVGPEESEAAHRDETQRLRDNLEWSEGLQAFAERRTPIWAPENG